MKKAAHSFPLFLLAGITLWMAAKGPSMAMAQSCVSDDGITAAKGFVVKRLYDTGGVGFLTLIDVAPAVGDYALPGGAEGVLFTTGAPDGGIGRIDRDGNFVNWLVTPGAVTFPRSAYIEYGYDGALYACDTVDLLGVWRIEPDGAVTQIADYPNCEGIAFGDIGDGHNALYVSTWTGSAVSRVAADGAVTHLVTAAFPAYGTGLAFARAGSAYPTGLYLVLQDGALFHIDYNPIGPTYTASLVGGFGVNGESIDFADPTSPFADFLYHPATFNSLQRRAANGNLEVVASGDAIDVFFHTDGAAFSTDGRSYYFTNEISTIWKVESCIVDDDNDDDGVPNSDDRCPDTPPGEPVLSNGCSVEQQCPCDAEWENHGQYVTCVVHSANALRDAGLITNARRSALVTAAAHSSCGK